MLLDLIAYAGLFFCHTPVIATVIIVGFLNRNEKIFGQALFLVTFTMIYNFYLKSIWQEPLPPPLEGWAFPSGHMHSAYVLWGWLALSYRKLWFSACVVAILGLVGFGLVYHGYHYTIDIFGSLGFGTVSLIIYYYLVNLSYFQKKPYAIGFLLSLLAFFIILLLPITKPHVWQAWGMLNGFALGWMILDQNHLSPFTVKQKLLTIIVAVLGSVCYFLIMKQLPLSPSAVIFAQFFCVALWISASKVVVNKLHGVNKVPNYGQPSSTHKRSPH